MNDMLIGMVASQLGIPSEVLAELKATKPKMLAAVFDHASIIPIATLTVEVRNPRGVYTVIISLPLSELRRIQPVYETAAKLANRK
jgi:hypothetical protein